MSRTPFNPLDTAAMRAAKARKATLNPDTPPLSPEQERALIEASVSLQSDPAPEVQEFLSGSPTRPLTIGQLNSFLAQALDSTLPPTFFVQGEISNFRTYDRGHAFFTLKDPSAELPCILWKDGLAKLKFKPANGLAVLARGSVRLYEPQGKLQLYVDTLLPQGTGGLELAFRQLCEKLRAEGLFEPARKRPIPLLPRHVVIITSRTGDVLHDVLTTAHRRFPGLHVSLYPVRVQGAQAAPDIIRAIEQINRYAKKLETRNSKPETPPIDLILLVRGGGSLEDLWAFNEEALARAIIASSLPIATGIGHEPDTTIADLVGDLRGPTPTAVTELTIPDVQTLLADLTAKSQLLTRDIRRLLTTARHDLERSSTQFTAVTAEALRLRHQYLEHLCKQIERIEPRHAIAQGWRRVEEAQRRLDKIALARMHLHHDTLDRLNHRLECASPRPRIARQHERIAHLQARLAAAIKTRLASSTQKLTAAAAQLRIISPQSTLDRGFSITTDREGNILRSTAQVKRGDLLTTQLADGTIQSTVGKPRQSSLF